ncbi:DUF2079 domain-containing protein [Patescibacteria group bacterium]|nr:DUF2079 domain-containing protein [Patescibacteria group bacterium]
MRINKFYSKIIVGLAIAFFIVLFSFLAIKRYQTLNSYYYDLGIMDQVVYNTSRGRLLQMTNQDLMKNVSRFAIHFDPIMIIFSPFYLIYKGPEILLVGQAAIVGMGAWAVFLLAEEILRIGHKKSKSYLMPVIFSLLYLFYFAIQRVVLFDFHGVALATTFLLFALYYLEVKKWNRYFFYIILSLFTKEHIGLVIFLLGLYIVFIKKEKRVGLITSLLGFAFFVVTVYLIIPLSRGGSHFAIGYFGHIRERFFSIIKDGFRYSIMILTPSIYSLFSPLVLMIAIPEWAINVVSSNNNMTSYLYHYNSVIVSFVFYSLILGSRNFNYLVKNKVIRNLFFIIYISLNLYSVYKYNPLPYFVEKSIRYEEIRSITRDTIDDWREKLKDENIAVSTTPKLAPFFTERITYQNFLYDPSYAEMSQTEDDIMKTIDDYKVADYVIIYRPEIGDIDSQTVPVKFYERLKEDKNYRMIYSDDISEKSIEVYRKIKS